MIRTRFCKTVALMAVSLAVVLIMGCKEHPAEHPAEHPKESGGKVTVTKDELADAIEVYVKEASTAEGYFVVNDEEAGKELKLTLDKVHRKRLSRVGEGLYFACADFKNIDGTIYDLDVFMKGTAKDNLSFSKFSVHKEAGKERYTWYEEGGVWKRKPEGSGTKDVEHPAEHPEGEKPPAKGSVTKASEQPAEHPAAQWLVVLERSHLH